MGRVRALIPCLAHAVIGLMAIWPIVAWGGESSTSSTVSQIMVRIAVRAHSGVDAAVEKWGPTSDALSQAISGYIFEVVPMVYFDEMRAAVENGTIGFVLTDPTAYAELEADFGVSRIVTLSNLRVGGGITEFAGVVFTRADRADIETLCDIPGHTMMGVHAKACGGWRMALRELKDLGIDPLEDCRAVLFPPDGIQESVVRAVMNGDVDIGTVRTGIIERLVESGELDAGAVKILNRMDDDLPLFHSTRRYPEWPFAALRETPDELARRVAIALLSMTPNDPAAVAGGYTGWTVPLDYSRVHDLLRELRVGPYKGYGRVTLGQFFRQHLTTVLVVAVAVVILFLFTANVVALNRRLHRAHTDLRQHQEHLEQLVDHRTAELRVERDKLKYIFAAMNDGIYIVNQEYDIEYVNPVLVADFGPYEERKCYTYFQNREGVCPWCRTPDVFAGKTVQREWTSPRNGKTYDLLGTPLRNADGSISKLEIFRDITNRKRAELTARKRATELRQMVNLMAGRENRMAELKRVIKKLRVQLKEAGVTPVADDPLMEKRSGKCER